MLPELGNFALVLALCFALLQGITSFSKKQILCEVGTVAVIGQFGFLLLSMFCLMMSFVFNDMSVLYVQEHSHALLPLFYRIGATWGGHEGSLLLWCLILSGWSLMFTMFGTLREKRTLGILGFISTGFILFLFYTSNPFARLFPLAPITGDDLTPVLQDPGLIFHPPMLYLGYVGFAIPFAFAISALLKGSFEKEWARQCKPWVVLPWAFLSCGIALGSWWAYRELGWGGWWFWDPVENASLLPWLSATALIHSLIVTEKRESFQGWTILLAIITFTLSLLGTFLVRSGILVSVHAFANDPTRGIFLLGYLAVIIFSAFILYGLRINKFYRAPDFTLFSRETFLLMNSVILLTAVATITLGTLYPIILDALNLEKISVGEPYFNTMFTPMFIFLLLLMSVAPHLQWQKDSFQKIKKLYSSSLISLILTLACPWLFNLHFYLLTEVGLFCGIWLIVSTLQYAWKIYQIQHKLSLNFWPMIIAHLAIAIIVLGITINKSYKEETQVKIAVGDTVTLANYQIHFKDLEETNAVNFQSIEAFFTVNKANASPKELIAEQRIYRSHQQALSRPGITANPWRDIYLALGNSVENGNWIVRIYYEPCVRWIWAGGFMLLLGGFLSLFNSWRARKSS